MRFTSKKTSGYLENFRKRYNDKVQPWIDLFDDRRLTKRTTVINIVAAIMGVASIFVFLLTYVAICNYGWFVGLLSFRVFVSIAITILASSVVVFALAVGLYYFSYDQRLLRKAGQEIRQLGNFKGDFRFELVNRGELLIDAPNWECRQRRVLTVYCDEGHGSFSVLWVNRGELVPLDYVGRQVLVLLDKLSTLKGFENVSTDEITFKRVDLMTISLIVFDEEHQCHLTASGMKISVDSVD